MTPLLLVDLETTGLDPRARGAGVLELGLRLVDGDDLDVMQSASWVIPYGPAYLDLMRRNAGDLVRAMHDASGLWQACAAAYRAPASLHPATDVRQWLRMVARDDDVPLCGSSVHFDRAWLEVHLPAVVKGRTHRLADVSAFRELLLRMGPGGQALVASRPRPAEPLHRVDPDLDATLAELRHYRDAIGPLLEVTR